MTPVFYLSPLGPLETARGRTHLFVKRALPIPRDALVTPDNIRIAIHRAVRTHLAAAPARVVDEFSQTLKGLIISTSCDGVEEDHLIVGLPEYTLNAITYAATHTRLN